jgi:hypothetical protein
VAATMQALGQKRASAHYALLIAAKAPSLDNDIAFIVATMNRFWREGLLTPWVLSGEAVLNLLEKWPVGAPVANWRWRRCGRGMSAIGAKRTWLLMAQSSVHCTAKYPFLERPLLAQSRRWMNDRF